MTGARGWLVLVALVVAAYLPFLGGGFLTDDFVHIDRLTHASGSGEVVNAPDAFGFFRPVTQASLYLESLIHPAAAPFFRLTNVVLEVLVVIAAFATARLLLNAMSAAALATLIFALTPKAHPIAVLWISARGELLMSLFALVATWAWIVWTRGGGRRWLATAIVAYALAILSKETAFLLPAALLVAPGATMPLRRRAAMAAVMIGVAAVAFAWRIAAGALVPSTSDSHYMLATPLFRWGRNARNYFWRLLPEPLAAVILVGIAGVLQRRSRDRERGTMNAQPATGAPEQRTTNLLFAMAWVAVFLLPVLPVVARNELYLYLPAFGMSILAVHLIATSLDLVSPSRHIQAAVVIFAIVCGAYQVSRSWQMHDELVFSGKLVDALAGVPGAGVVLLVGDDEETRRLLKDTIGGYLPAVLRRAAPDGRLIASESGDASLPGVVRLRCSYHDRGLVLISQETSQ